VLRGIGIIEMGIRGLDRQTASFPHRIARIDREIEDCRLELRSIHMDTPQSAREHRLHSDRLAEGTAQ